MKSVYCTVGTGSLNKAALRFVFKGLIFILTNGSQNLLLVKAVIVQQGKKLTICGNRGFINVF
jgi:hypothetical protein